MTHIRLLEFTALKCDVPNENADRHIVFQKREQKNGCFGVSMVQVVSWSCHLNSGRTSGL